MNVWSIKIHKNIFVIDGGLEIKCENRIVVLKTFQSTFMHLRHPFVRHLGNSKVRYSRIIFCTNDR